MSEPGLWFFTDGSSKGSFSAVHVANRVADIQTGFELPTPTLNIGAEINGLQLALKSPHITYGAIVFIVHDYLGLSAWSSGAWRMKEHEVIEKMSCVLARIVGMGLDVRFIHHKGHGKGNDDFTYYNAIADQACTDRYRRESPILSRT